MPNKTLLSNLLYCIWFRCGFESSEMTAFLVDFKLKSSALKSYNLHGEDNIVTCSTFWERVCVRFSSDYDEYAKQARSHKTRRL